MQTRFIPDERSLALDERSFLRCFSVSKHLTDFGPIDNAVFVGIVPDLNPARKVDRTRFFGFHASKMPEPRTLRKMIVCTA